MKYLEFTFRTVPCTEIVNDVLSGVLGEAGFESFVEQTDGITAYIQKELYNESLLKEALADFPLPGGTGTLEEIAEIISKVSLKQLDAPCILYNLNGYYDHLKALLALMIEKGLSSEERQEGIFFAENLEEIRQILSGK